jgi:hypothetical protein
MNTDITRNIDKTCVLKYDISEIPVVGHEELIILKDQKNQKHSFDNISRQQ